MSKYEFHFISPVFEGSILGVTSPLHEQNTGHWKEYGKKEKARCRCRGVTSPLHEQEFKNL